MISKIRNLFHHLTLTVFIYLFLAEPHMVMAVRSTPLIINHTAITEFDHLNDAAIQNASNLRLLLRHASVGNRIGMAGVAPDGTYSGLEDIKNIYGSKYNRDLWNFSSRGNPSWQTKLTDLTSWASVNINSYDLFSMKFCYIDYLADWETYRSTLEQLETTYPQKSFIWWTIPIMTLTASSSTTEINEQIQRQTFNQQVRLYAREQNKILYDIAAIEAFDYDTQTTSRITLNNTSLETYPSKYTNDGGHPAAGAGRIILAKAVWVMMAQIAGWNPNETTPTISPSPSPSTTPSPTQTPIPTPTPLPGDASGDGNVDGVDYIIWLNHYNQSTSGTTGVGDFDNNGVVDGIDYVIWLNNYAK